ncbi:MAG: hypothetical protein B7Z02_13700 [Rhodobacterales bacterium 32-67-9]|nr:MAG: hypothetical protein B7Z02_13700 [Rhodobacterales bacterium 32-67-9]
MAKSPKNLPRVLRDFYSAASSPEGISVADLPSMIDKVCAETREPTDIHNRRTSADPWKKFEDEVCPVSRFLKCRGFVNGHVRFPLDDQVPDAWYSPGGRAKPIGIEVTIALGKQRYVLADHLNQHGCGPGFLDESDDDFNALRKSAAKPHEMYSTEQALERFKEGINERLCGKNEPKYKGFILVIDAPLEVLPQERWGAILDDLTKEASCLPFSEVHVVSDRAGALSGFKLK